MIRAISKDQVLKLWQARWGELSPDLIGRFLENDYLEFIVKYEFESVLRAIGDSQRLGYILEKLQAEEDLSYLTNFPDTIHTVQNCPSCGAPITNIEVNCRC